MCGIAGIFTVERRADASLVAAVLRMLDAQVHRGPNDWGILIPEEAARDHEIRALLEARGWEHVTTYPSSRDAPAAVLGNRRLSILDLSPEARMPMGTPDGRLWVTYNGEIYNFPELRSELAARGYHFRSQGDTETLLYGYVEWGPEVVRRLRGMFAFAVLDARSAHGPSLFLAKDRFGIKPLYWARKNCVFQFASEVRALMAGGLIPNEPEPRGFHGFLIYGSVPTPWTTVRDVLSLPAAHRMPIDEISYSHPKPQRYWALPEEGSLRVSREDAIAETRRLVEESVRMHLVSDVPVGVFLSGGMDSAALVALGARHSTAPVTTLTVSFDEPDLSEGDAAAATARRHGTKHVDVRVRESDFLDDLDRFLAAMDQPTVDGLNTWVVARAAREAGLTVVLSGVGGDEMFHGYPGFRRAPGVARAAKVLGASLGAALVGRTARALGHPRLEKLEFLREHPLLGPYLIVRGLFPPRRAARLLDAGRLPLWAPDAAGPALTPDIYARLEIAHYLEHQLLRDTDVFGMAHSLEVRVPFLDHRLVELLLALPAAHLCAGPGAKPLLRAALRDAGLDAAAARPKAGFTLPLDRWLAGGWARIARATAHDGPVGGAAAEALARQHRAGRVHWSRPWAVAVLRNHARQQALPWDCGGPPAKLLFLLPQVSGTGGIPRYNQALLRAASEALPRAELAVVSVNDHAPPSGASLEGRLRFHAAGPRERALHKMRVVVHAFAAVLLRRPAAVVCGHINLMPLAWLLGRIACVPTLLLAYGIEALSPPLLLRFAARQATRVLPISRWTASQMTAWGVHAGRVTLLPNGVDGEVYRPIRERAPRDVHPSLLSVCRLDASERYKGVDRVLEALGVLQTDVGAVRYVVVGDGDDLPRLRELACQLGVADRVEFRGLAADEALPGTYSAADLFVMPSKREGFGFVFLEALACGTPVVAGNSDGSVDALLDGNMGRLVDLEDGQALVAAIRSSLDGWRARRTWERRALRTHVLATYGFDRFRARVAEVLAPAGGRGWPRP